MVQSLVAFFIIVCIIAVLGMIIRQSRDARKPRQEEWCRGPVASTIEVERELRSAVQPVAPNPELFQQQPAPEQHEQTTPTQPAEQTVADELPSIDELFD